MDSDTMLTLENTNDAIKRAENYMQRQDTDGDKRVAFSSAVDDSTDGHDEVNTLRAALKEKDQRLSALEAKFGSLTHGQTDGGNKRKKTAKKNEKECNYCKRLLTSVASATAPSTLSHNSTCARAHAGRVSAFCSKESLAICVFFFSSGFTRGGLVTHNLSSLPGLAFFCNQLAYGRLVIRRAVEMATLGS
jgi:hypothetical protein